MQIRKSIFIVSICFLLTYGAVAQAGFIDNSDGTVTDTDTGLMWQQATAPGTYTWEQSLSYCENSALAGYTDWRLPTAKELASLTDKNRNQPAINTIYFPDTAQSGYWTSTTVVNITDNAWYVSFMYGVSTYYSKANYGYVRAVRLGQSGSFADLTLWPIPDTGQTQSYTSTFGEDHDYTINQPSYTKLAAGCAVLPDNAPTWAMVRDDVTGLVWEEKHSLDGVQNYADSNDADNTYTWYDGTIGFAGAGTDMQDFIEGLNTANYGGYSDWRMPTIQELSAILDYGRNNPAANTTYFPENAAANYWSSSYTLGAFESPAWNVAFSSGYVGGTTMAAKQYVRAVRSGPCVLSDSDDDGIDDTLDNCPAVVNPLQLDADADGIGDVCDPTPGCGGCGMPECENPSDGDGDQWEDKIDNCPALFNYRQLDADGDGMGDCCDPEPGCGGCGQPDCDTVCPV